MKISIIVPTCGPTPEDTYTPKGDSAFFYPRLPDDDDASLSTVSTEEEYTGHTRGTHNSPTRDDVENYYSRESNQIVINQGHMTGGFGSMPEPLTSSTMYNTLVVGKQPPNHRQAVHMYNEASKNRSLTPSTVPMEHSDSESTGSISSGSISRAQHSRDQRDDFESVSLVQVADAKYGRSLGRIVSTKTNETARKKGTVENISCAAESMERDFFSLFGSMLGFEEPDEMNCDSINEDEANDEEEVPATRIYADMRKQRLRNQFLTFERDNLKQQLKERLEEIQQLKQRIQEQDVETKKFQLQALQQSEKVADMMNDLLDI